jgi:hypothetical protein
MVIDFRGEIDLAAIRKTVALMSNSSIWMTALRAAVAILILATLGGLIFSYFSGEMVSTNRLVRLAIQDVVLGYFVVSPYIASRQLFKRLSAGDQRVRGTVYPMGISFKADDSSQTIEYPWDSFYHVYKADDLVVLATADFRTSILPRPLFANEQDWQHFCQYVDSRVHPIK